NIGEQLRDVPASGRHATAKADVAEDDGIDRHLDVMRGTDRANHSAGAGDRERGGHRLPRSDALERGLDPEAAGHREDGIDGSVACEWPDPGTLRRVVSANGTRTASPWPPSMPWLPNPPPLMQFEGQPARQIGHVPSE